MCINNNNKIVKKFETLAGQQEDAVFQPLSADVASSASEYMRCAILRSIFLKLKVCTACMHKHSEEKVGHLSVEDARRKVKRRGKR